MKKRLSDQAAEVILTMITIEKRFVPGEKLPNENDLSAELEISRTTLREAIRILTVNGVLEVRRGLGTFIKEDLQIDALDSLSSLSAAKTDIRDLYEIRLIFEPEAAYLAAVRASDGELKHILHLGERIEYEIENGIDRTETERNFHKAIAKATHNDFMTRLMPVIFQSIDKGVMLSEVNQKMVEDTVRDHKMIMEFLMARNPEGAKNAMKIHILHAVQELDG